VIAIHHIVLDFERLWDLVSLLRTFYQEFYLPLQFLHHWQVLVNWIPLATIERSILVSRYLKMSHISTRYLQISCFLVLEDTRLGMESSSISQQIGWTCSAYRRRLFFASTISSIIPFRVDFPNASTFEA
jgi:hypothetical protein